MNVTLQRISRLIAEEGIGMNEFDRRIGRKGYVSNAISRDSRIRESTLRKIKMAFPEYNIAWLRGEDVPMYEKNVENLASEAENDNPNHLNDFEIGILKALRKNRIRKEIQSIIAEMPQE